MMHSCYAELHSLRVLDLLWLERAFVRRVIDLGLYPGTLRGVIKSYMGCDELKDVLKSYISCD